MTDFRVLQETLVPLDAIQEPSLADLVAYWRQKKGDRPFALRKDIDPTEMPKLLGSIRLVAIEAAGVFRFRLYGMRSTNPDRTDMTGKTTGDYQDKGFAEMVTRHYGAVAAAGEPRCWAIEARVAEGRYAYLRVVLPISFGGEVLDGLLVKSSRIHNDALLRAR